LKSREPSSLTNNEINEPELAEVEHVQDDTATSEDTTPTTVSPKTSRKRKCP
jgi:hypothetical protein